MLLLSVSVCRMCSILLLSQHFIKLWLLMGTWVAILGNSHYSYVRVDKTRSASTFPLVTPGVKVYYISAFNAMAS